MKKEVEMDIDTLGRMVADGFTSVEGRIDGLDGRVSELGKEVRATNHRIDVTNQHIESTNQRIDRIILPALDDHARCIKDLEIQATE